MINVPRQFTTVDTGDFVAKVATKTGDLWGVTIDTRLIGIAGADGERGYWVGKPQ